VFVDVEVKVWVIAGLKVFVIVEVGV
jgi:hypothetical protein